MLSDVKMYDVIYSVLSDVIMYDVIICNLWFVLWGDDV